MIAPLADTAELPRVTPGRPEPAESVRLGSPASGSAAPASGSAAPPEPAPAPGAGSEPSTPSPDRRPQRVERRLARRQRRLAVSLGLAVLAAFLAGAVVVVGVVR